MIAMDILIIVYVVSWYNVLVTYCCFVKLSPALRSYLKSLSPSFLELSGMYPATTSLSTHCYYSFEF